MDLLGGSCATCTLTSQPAHLPVSSYGSARMSAGLVRTAGIPYTERTWRVGVAHLGTPSGPVEKFTRRFEPLADQQKTATHRPWAVFKCLSIELLVLLSASLERTIAKTKRGFANGSCT